MSFHRLKRVLAVTGYLVVASAFGAGVSSAPAAADGWHEHWHSANIRDKLTADHSGIEVTYVPFGTQHIGVAELKKLNSGQSETKYFSVPPNFRFIYPKDAGYPVLDVQAWSRYHPIGDWAGRKLTEQPVVEEPEELEESAIEKQEKEEKLQKEREQREQNEKEVAEHEKVEKERIEHEKAEKERIEREKVEKEREEAEKPVETPKGLLPGVTSGKETIDYEAVGKAHAKVVRVEFFIGSSNLTNEIKAVAAEVEKRGARLEPLLGFAGEHPSSTTFHNAGLALKANPEIVAGEDGNETSFGYQYNDGFSSNSYHERARWYAEGCKALSESAAPVGVICQAEDGGSGSSVWVDEMFKAVPNLSSYVIGWVIHPYSNQKSSHESDTSGVPKTERMTRNLAAHGDTKIPYYITEWGVPSENGTTLNDGKHLTFAEAAEVVKTQIPAVINAAKEHGVRSWTIYQTRDQRAQGTDTEREHYFGIFTHTLGNKGAYTEAVLRFELGEIL